MELKAQLQEAAGKGKQLKKLQSHCTDLKQCFQCIVCKDTVEFPAVVSPCCNIMLVCESHIQEWLDGSPQCRAPLDMEDCLKIPMIRSLKDALDASVVPSPPSSPIRID